MIIEALINLVKIILLFVIGLFPQADTVPAGIQSALAFMQSSFNKANLLFPLDTVIKILGIYLTIEGSILLFHFANWGYNKVRGSG